MKTEKEILERLEEARSEYLQLQEHYNKTYESYKKQRDFWGKDLVDRGEMDYISDLSTNAYNEIKLLEWVMGNTCSCGVSLPSDIEICPTCVDKLQVEMYEDQIDCEEKEAESLINMMKDDGLNYLHDGPL